MCRVPSISLDVSAEILAYLQPTDYLAPASPILLWAFSSTDHLNIIEPPPATVLSHLTSFCVIATVPLFREALRGSDLTSSVDIFFTDARSQYNSSNYHRHPTRVIFPRLPASGIPLVPDQSLWLMLSEVNGRKPFYYTPSLHGIRAVKWR